MIEIINNSIEESFAFNKWPYLREADFKHELFYILSKKEYKNTLLGARGEGHLTPRIHAESKAQNGLKGNKADIIICDPSIYNLFNYEVNHVIELKLKFNEKNLNDEFDKLNIYSKKFETYWIVACNNNNAHLIEKYKKHENANKLIFKIPEKVIHTNSVKYKSYSKMNDVYEIVNKCIRESLHQYGGGKNQYQSFYWCNYEHEQERGHSFPSEGDFNAHLYCKLRDNLPDDVIVFSEYKPIKLKKRIDFLIASNDKEWAIPIEVKMNWDQFKRKYKNDKLIDSEATTIIYRYNAVRNEYSKTKPILVVIQGSWRIQNKNKKIGNDNKSYAIRDLSKYTDLFEFICFDENSNTIRTEW